MVGLTFTQSFALRIASGLILMLGLYQIWIYLSSQHRSRSVISALANMFVVVALIVLTDGMSLLLARLSGLANIGWYLGYSMGAISCYIFARLAYMTDVHRYGRHIKQYLRVGLICVLMLQLFLYATHLVQQSEWPSRTPRTVEEYLFCTIFFLFSVSVTLTVGITTRTAILRETNPAQKLRLWINLCGTATLLICFVGRQFYITLYFFYADLLWINQIVLLALATSGLWFGLSISPSWLLRFFVTMNPLTYLQQLWQLYWLHRLTGRIYGLMPENRGRRHGLLHQLRNIRLSTYQLLIATLDGKRQLADCLYRVAQRRRKSAGIDWSHAQEHQATAILHALNYLDSHDDKPYPALIQEVIRVSRQIEHQLR